MKLEITKEKVLEAASKCSQAKETLKTLFPEVFAQEKFVTISPNTTFLAKDEDTGVSIMGVANGIADDSSLQLKCFYLLANGYEWELRPSKTSSMYMLLIPTRK